MWRLRPNWQQITARLTFPQPGPVFSWQMYRSSFPGRSTGAANWQSARQIFYPRFQSESRSAAGYWLGAPADGCVGNIQLSRRVAHFSPDCSVEPRAAASSAAEKVQRGTTAAVLHCLVGKVRGEDTLPLFYIIGDWCTPNSAFRHTLIEFSPFFIFSALYGSTLLLQK